MNDEYLEETHLDLFRHLLFIVWPSGVHFRNDLLHLGLCKASVAGHFVQQALHIL